ncbi:DUF885 domain-containing protein [Algicola sagamiensis]|uniref:DUF885 domain-containing protein n=1 Tax=Algicola sagamiensis TaxID=163869 RepID=UPI000363C427
MKPLAYFVCITSLLTGCSNDEAVPPKAAKGLPGVNVQQQQPAVQLTQLLDDIYTKVVLNRSPIRQSALGIKTDQDKWDNISKEYREQTRTIIQQQKARLQTIPRTSLSDSDKLNLTLMQFFLEQKEKELEWFEYQYMLDQMNGVQSILPSMLINQHQINTKEDALAYIQRLRGMQLFFAQVETITREQAKKGILPPKFVFAYVLQDARNILQGAPFEAGKDSTLLADFKSKLVKTKLSNKEKTQLEAEAIDALKTDVAKAYSQLISFVQQLAKQANNEDGVWKFENGGKYYSYRLKTTTSTNMNAMTIHQIGLEEVSRIHLEMKNIMTEVQFKGSLQDFFAFMRNDKRFTLPNTEAGRQAYLNQVDLKLKQMESKLDELFITKPKAKLVVKRVEAYREKSAGKAFYTFPSMDGSRPGYYYTNLYDMKDMPTYQLEALAFHEGLPGHHMQASITQELDELPMFRKFWEYDFISAYVEGWGLYSELIPKDIGFYEDPYSDFGRLAMELWRACRLVVDTGLHAKHWTREQAIDYLKRNTPNPEGDIVKAIDRYIVMPGQATAYKIGMLKILTLREKAKHSLNERFDIREFHDIILRDGPLPLNLLEANVNHWVDRKLKI